MVHAERIVHIFLVVCLGMLIAEARIALPDGRVQSVQLFDPCRDFACLNGGTCTAPADAPSCLCPSGYSGSRCETKDGDVISRDPCRDFACFNGGTCTAPADAPSCLCPSGYTGSRCETRDGDIISRDPCRDFVCYNGGTCTAPADLPSCLCPSGYTGSRCETKDGDIISRDPCRNFACYNGGTCTAPADLPSCICPSGYTGSRCQKRVNVNRCGPCPTGWSCRPNPGIVCVMAPCLDYTCVPPADRCGGCPAGQTCRMVYPPCAPPPPECDGDNLSRRARRSIRCSQYRCKPVPVCQ